MRLGAIEAGGTKMVCALGNEQGEVIERASFPTTTPQETLPKLIEFFAGSGIEALGMGYFGPVDLNKQSPTYGHILQTPKAGWQMVDVVTPLQQALRVPVALDTDVNAAVLGEAVHGAAQGCTDAVYMTVGTGIGCGVYINGALLHGCLHPEAGHMLVLPHTKESMPCGCPFHGSCLEGMAAGPAIAKRWGRPGAELYHNPQVWELEAWYLGQAVANMALCYAPQRIILGGGVMHAPGLLQQVRVQAQQLLGGYLQGAPADMDSYVTAPGLGENSGVVGALELARRALA